MTPIPPALRALYRPTSVRDRLRLAQRWYGSPFADVEPHVPRSGTIVDAGCGFGLFAAVLALAAPERTVVGVDLDAQKIARGNKLFGQLPNVRLAVGDLAATPLPPCEGVVVYDVLHHLRDTTVDALLSAAYACLSPGGVLVVKENDTEPGWKRAIAEGQETIAVTGGITASDPWRFRTRSDWVDTIGRAGFRVTHAAAIGCHGYGRLLPHSLFVGVK